MSPGEIADRLFTAIEAGDASTVRELYAPDAVIWHNTDDLEQTREDNVATLQWMATHLPGARYTDVRRITTDDAFVQQHVLMATNRAGEDVADGLITRLDEYLDSTAVAKLLVKPEQR